MYVREIWYFDSSVTEDLGLVGCDQMSLDVWLLARQKNIVPSSSKGHAAQENLGLQNFGSP